MISNTIKHILNESEHGYVPEYLFAKKVKRKFRADFAILKYGILIEAEGIGSFQSRHTNKFGYSKDCEKYNIASILGFFVLRYTTFTDDPYKIEADINKIILRIKKYSKYKETCFYCKENLFVNPNLWVKINENKFSCLICDYLKKGK